MLLTKPVWRLRKMFRAKGGGNIYNPFSVHSNPDVDLRQLRNTSIVYLRHLRIIGLAFQAIWARTHDLDRCEFYTIVWHGDM
jgi:hypothetical protein